MDRCHVESGDWLHEGKSGLQALLRRAARGPVAGHGQSPVHQRLRRHASFQSARIAAPVAQTTTYFCEQHERSLSRRYPRGIHQAGVCDHESRFLAQFSKAFPRLPLNAIDWVIVGGESGPGHRPISAEWIRGIRDQCERERVAFFFKQSGGRTSKSGGNIWTAASGSNIPTLPNGNRHEHRRNIVSEQSMVGPWAKEKLACLGKYLHAYI